MHVDHERAGPGTGILQRRTKRIGPVHTAPPRAKNAGKGRPVQPVILTKMPHHHRVVCQPREAGKTGIVRHKVDHLCPKPDRRRDFLCHLAHATIAGHTEDRTAQCQRSPDCRRDGPPHRCMFRT